VLLMPCSTNRASGSRRAPRSVRGVALAALSLALLSAAPLLAEKISQLKPTGYVNDFAGVLSGAARARLAALCAEVDQKANAQIAIVTVRTVGGASIEDYAIDLATHWGIGPKKSDRGVLILLAIQDHKYRIEVGYGLEGILPDGRVGGFGREAVPLLRRGDYDGGISLLARRIADVIAQDRGVALTSTPAIPERSVPERGLNWFGILPILFFFLGIPLLRWLLPLIFFGALWRGRHGRRGVWGAPGGWIGGGGWGGSVGGGGGGGGFGGFGGGGFGGGGASGGW